MDFNLCACMLECTVHNKAVVKNSFVTWLTLNVLFSLPHKSIMSKRKTRSSVISPAPSPFPFLSLLYHTAPDLAPDTPVAVPELHAQHCYKENSVLNDRCYVLIPSSHSPDPLIFPSNLPMGAAPSTSSLILLTGYRRLILEATFKDRCAWISERRVLQEALQRHVVLRTNVDCKLRSYIYLKPRGHPAPENLLPALACELFWIRVAPRHPKELSDNWWRFGKGERKKLFELHHMRSFGSIA